MSPSYGPSLRFRLLLLDHDDTTVRGTEEARLDLSTYKYLSYFSIYDPGFRVRGPPPPPNGLGPPRSRERSSRLVCVEASQHALHVYIHTHRLYIHTYILTDKYIHTPIHACTYRHAPPTHMGGRGEDHLSPLHTKTCAPRPFGGGVRPLGGRQATAAHCLFKRGC